MPMLAHFGPDMVEHPWWGAFGWLMPLVILLLVAGVAVWAVARLTSEHRPAVAGSAAALAPRITADAPLERARMRYANGEMTHEEFARLSRDLGAPVDDEEAGDV